MGERNKDEETRIQGLIGGYMAGNLTESEKADLLSAAFSDQAVFDELVEEDALRAILARPDFRNRVRRTLRESTVQESRQRRGIFSFLFGKVGLSVAAAAAAAVAVVLVIGNHEPGSPGSMLVQLSSPNAPEVSARQLIEAPIDQQVQKELSQIPARPLAPPAANAPSTALALDRSGSSPKYRVGDAIRIGFRVDRAANVVLMEEYPDGSSARLFPNKFISGAHMNAGQQMLVPPAGQGDLAVEGPTGRRKLRLYIFPPDVDPLASSSFAGAGVVEKSYEVIP